MTNSSFLYIMMFEEVVMKNGLEDRRWEIETMGGGVKSRVMVYLRNRSLWTEL